MKKGKFLFVFCEGTDHDLTDGSIVARYYQLLKARPIDVRPYKSTKIGSNFDVLQGEIYSLDPKMKSPHDKIYLPGPGSATNTPGKHAPALGIHKRKVKTTLKNCAPKEYYKKLKEFYGVHTRTIHNTFRRYLNGIANGEGRYDNVSKVYAIVAAKLGFAEYKSITPPISREKPDLEEDSVDSKSEAKNEVNEEYTEILIIGWSRGAVTAQHIRNQLAEITIIPVSLFLIDPVAGREAGLTDFTTRAYIPAKVDYRLFAHGDETREFFPQSLERLLDDIANPYQRIKAFPVYGSHSQVAGSPKINLNNPTSAPALITEILLITFFKEAIGEQGAQEVLGDKLKKLNYSNSECIALYTHTQVNVDLYEDRLSRSRLSSDKIMYTKGVRPFSAELEKYVKHPQFFVNRDHEAKFAESFPDFYWRIDRLDDRYIPEILSRGFDLCTKTILITSILCEDLDTQIKKIPLHKPYVDFRELVTGIRRGIQQKIYAEIGASEAITAKIEIFKKIRVCLETLANITEILNDNIPFQLLLGCSLTQELEISQEEKSDEAEVSDEMTPDPDIDLILPIGIEQNDESKIDVLEEFYVKEIRKIVTEQIALSNQSNQLIEEFKHSKVIVPNKNPITHLQEIKNKHSEKKVDLISEFKVKAINPYSKSKDFCSLFSSNRQTVLKLADQAIATILAQNSSSS